MLKFPDADLQTLTRNGEGLRARSLVFIAPRDSVADCVIHAIEREFPYLTATTCDGVGNMKASATSPASLILVDAALVAMDDDLLAKVHRLWPRATMAVTIDNLEEAEAVLPALLAAPAIRGLLPMNLKLDLWLSILGLMLRGGEYFPATLLRSQANPSPNQEASARQALPDERSRPASADYDALPFDALTERERQVLELVARGSPNKLIAEAFGLSEHTVKIHIHNLIRKLRVHNRTEAAAFFLQAVRPDQRAAVAMGSM